jgi:hypothetical protein
MSAKWMTRRMLRRYAHLGRRERGAVVRAVAWLLLARAALALLPFRAVLRVADRPPVSGRTFPESRDPGTTIWAVKAVGDRLFPKNPCLPQALVTHWYLRGVGLPSELRISVRKDRSGKFGAHAWVESEGTAVIGGEVLPYGFVPLRPVDSAKDEV